MRIPINHTTITPSLQLTMALQRLAQIAAGAYVLGESNLERQARDAYNKLVNDYNSQLPSDRPKGFWAQFKDNLTFRDLDTTIAMRLKTLDASDDFEMYKGIFEKMSRNELVPLLNKIIRNEL